MTSLNQVARALVAPGKGILAADESSGTIKKRFDSIGVESTEDRRRAYREMLFTTAGADGNISGVILFDETIRQQASDGRQLVKVLDDAGIIPGIKVDKGTTPLAFAPGELVTDGLDGLRARLVEYRELGAKFAKWRAVIDIGDGIPSAYCIDVNAHALARWSRRVRGSLPPTRAAARSRSGSTRSAATRPKTGAVRTARCSSPRRVQPTRSAA